MSLLSVLEASGALDLTRSSSVANERDRSISSEVVGALRPLGVFRMYLPSAFGGPEVAPLESMRVISALSAADAATGWCATIASLTSHIAGVLEADVVRDVFANDGIVCGAFAPSGRGQRVAGGYRVSGRWSWGSGIGLASWMTGGTVTDSGSFVQMIFPARDLTVHDTWYSSGLCGTGSHDFSVADAFVAEGYEVVLGQARPTVDSPVARMPLFALFSGGVASVMIGIARRAIDELLLLATEKKPAQSSKTLAQSPMVQVDVAKANAIVGSCAAYLEDTVGAVWETVLRGDRVSTEQRLAARLSAAHVGAEACRAVDLMYNAGGGSSVFSSSPLQRCFRDVHTASAHIMVSPRTFETFGRHSLGQPIDLSSL